MNLRISNNDLRLRLSDIEFELLRARCPLTECLRFGDTVALALHVALADELELAYEDGKISIVLDEPSLESVSEPANRKRGASIPTPKGWPTLQVQIDIRKSGNH